MSDTERNPLKVLYVEAPSARFGSTISLLTLISAVDRKKIEPVVVINALNLASEDFRRLSIPVYKIKLPGAAQYFGEARRSTPVGHSQLGLLSFIAAVLKYLRDKVFLRSQIKALQNIIDLVRPDIVHLNNQPSTNRFAYYCDLKGAKLVQHIRNAPLTRSRLISFLCRRVDLFICISEFVRNSMVADLSIDRDAKVIYNPIYNDFYNICLPASAERFHRPFSFIQIGRIIPIKGQKALIEAVSILKSRGWTTSDMKVNLLGVIEHRTCYEVELREWVQSHGLNDIVSFSRYSTDVIGALSSAHALIHVTAETEGFGRVVAEAMAVGLPVIVSGIGALPELVSDGINGLVVSTPVELANAMEGLMLDFHRCAKLGFAARKRAEDFRVDKHAHAICEYYEQLF